MAKTVEEFRENVVESLPDLATVAVPQFSVGYILDRNRKYLISNNEELQDAFDEAEKGYPFWVDPYETSEAPVRARGSKGTKRKFL